MRRGGGVRIAEAADGPRAAGKAAEIPACEHDVVAHPCPPRSDGLRGVPALPGVCEVCREGRNAVAGYNFAVAVLGMATRRFRERPIYVYKSETEFIYIRDNFIVEGNQLCGILKILAG
jgi:hypothetical protein